MSDDKSNLYSLNSFLNYKRDEIAKLFYGKKANIKNKILSDNLYKLNVSYDYSTTEINNVFSSNNFSTIQKAINIWIALSTDIREFNTEELLNLFTLGELYIYYYILIVHNTKVASCDSADPDPDDKLILRCPYNSSMPPPLTRSKAKNSPLPIRETKTEKKNAYYKHKPLNRLTKKYIITSILDIMNDTDHSIEDFIKKSEERNEEEEKTKYTSFIDKISDIIDKEKFQDIKNLFSEFLNDINSNKPLNIENVEKIYNRLDNLFDKLSLLEYLQTNYSNNKKIIEFTNLKTRKLIYNNINSIENVQLNWTFIYFDEFLHEILKVDFFRHLMDYDIGEINENIKNVFKNRHNKIYLDLYKSNQINYIRNINKEEIANISNIIDEIYETNNKLKSYYNRGEILPYNITTKITLSNNIVYEYKYTVMNEIYNINDYKYRFYDDVPKKIFKKEYEPFKKNTIIDIFINCISLTNIYFDKLHINNNDYNTIDDNSNNINITTYNSMKEIDNNTFLPNSPILLSTKKVDCIKFSFNDFFSDLNMLKKENYTQFNFERFRLSNISSHNYSYEVNGLKINNSNKKSSTNFLDNIDFKNKFYIEKYTALLFAEYSIEKILNIGHSLFSYSNFDRLIYNSNSIENILLNYKKHFMNKNDIHKYNDIENLVNTDMRYQNIFNYIIDKRKFLDNYYNSYTF